MSVWVEAARPRTLPASVAPVAVGTAAADRFIAWRFAAALVVALALQVGVNYANDYFDGVRGIDTHERVGPRRVVAAGLVAPAAMRSAMLAAFLVAGLSGLALAAAAGWELLAVGAAALLAAAGYSGGPRPYASAGLGEAAVFVFFGLIATAGSQYVQDERLASLAVAAALPVGLLVTAILVANNLRDIATDRVSGKVTLAVRLGDARTRSLYLTLVVAAFALTGLVAAVAARPWPLLALAALPAAVPVTRTVRTAREPQRLIAALVGTARLLLVYALLLAVGLAVR
ncbi:MAG TPA: 1,4-dihydroxy-2-naphthoate polyprenyltransferase [Nitriliruptorales bacterium]|nr:1,4-dihydroxy-2-naphthoate polyprenyltransferase [Nitriliruptorales bacterium]